MTDVKPGTVYIVGVGPGDPDLMTIRAKKIIDAADLIIYTGSLLGDDGFRDLKPTAKLVDSAGLHLQQIVDLMTSAARDGQVVARVHDGDPAIFGALSEQAAPLEAAGIPFEVVPGVTAAFAAAAALKAELTIPELAQTVILTRVEGRTPVPDGEKLRDLARHGATLVLYLSIVLIDRVARESGIAAALAGSQQSGANGYRVRLEKAPFDGMVSFLSLLTQHNGVVVESAAVDATDNSGIVNATLVLHKV